MSSNKHQLKQHIDILNNQLTAAGKRNDLQETRRLAKELEEANAAYIAEIRREEAQQRKEHEYSELAAAQQRVRDSRAFQAKTKRQETSRKTPEPSIRADFMMDNKRLNMNNLNPEATALEERFLKRSPTVSANFVRRTDGLGPEGVESKMMFGKGSGRKKKNSKKLKKSSKSKRKVSQVNKKNVLGKQRNVYKFVGNRKEYIKYKNKYVSLKKYKEMHKTKPKSKSKSKK
jgi:hypothetical protein